LLVLLILAGIVFDGSRTTPANPTKPIALRGSADDPHSPMKTLRVATFNIHSGKGRDRQMDLARTASVLSKSPTPDLVGLNEVRGTWDEHLWPDQAASLGRSLRLQSAFVPTERRWWHDHFGNAVLSRLPVKHIHRLPLAGTRGKAFRCATLTQMPFHGQNVQFLVVHVDSQSDREQQLRAVIDLFLGLQPPAILAGDLNSNSADPLLKELLARPDVVDTLKDAPPDARGRAHIDWILARGFKCHSGTLVENDASDHPAVIAELELIESAPPSAEAEETR
jgi:endonuclease/exonuclease/phosphatase family metal-dependent hydrolase